MANQTRDLFKKIEFYHLNFWIKSIILTGWQNSPLSHIEIYVLHFRGVNGGWAEWAIAHPDLGS